ncbi:MAG: response regulator [Spirochaetia bacterium]|nr:response regulator [Spirochaetia bacterium]
MDFNQACLNNSSIIILINPDTGQILNANKKASQFYGYSIEEFQKMNISDINTLSKDQIKKAMQLAKSENRNYFNFPHKLASGEIIEVEVQSFPTLIDNNTVLFSLINPNINSNNFTKIDSKYYEETNDSICILDQEMRIINYNKNFSLFFSYSSSLLGKTICNLINTEETAKLKKLSTTILKGSASDIDLKITDKNNDFIFINILAIPTIFRNNFFGAIVFIRNKTEEVQKDKANTERLEAALKKAELYRKTKDNFFSRMSHDMKTPLTAILSYSEFGLNGNASQEIKDYFKQINQSAEYLLTLVKDILNINTIEAGKIQLFPKPISKKLLLNNILGIIKAKANEKNIKLITNFDKIIWPYQKFDISRLEQIYLNILSNAINYSNEGSTVTWTKKYIHDENNKPYFFNIVSDNGIGMSEEFQKIMYEPFTQEDNDNKSVNVGNGLGLSITKNLIDLHGGKIWCESKINQGTTFYFQIPANEITKNEYLTYIKKTKKTTILKGKKILICDDNLINIKIIDKILKSYGIFTDNAENGLLAIEKTKVNEYFLILMDIQMSKLSGIETTKIIRSFNQNIPIIALSANSYESDIEACYEAGMNLHLSKPIDQNELFDSLLNFID